MTIPFITCGGMFWWFDRYQYAGWRIQENIWTHRCRLLDSHDVRRFSGTFEACSDKLPEFLKIWEEPKPNGETVVFIHGLFQTPGSFDYMKTAFYDKGYEAVSFSYPQLRSDLEDAAKKLNAALKRRKDIKRLHFIVHGVGGLVLRKALMMKPEWQSVLGRVVMISVPNKGFFWAGKWSEKKWYKFLLGKMGSNITPEFVSKNVPAMSGDFAVLMSGKDNGKGYLPFMGEDNDGILKVSEAFVKNAKEDFLTIGVPHFFLQKKEKTIEMCLFFIESGRLGKGKRIRRESNLMSKFYDR